MNSLSKGGCIGSLLNSLLTTSSESSFIRSFKTVKSFPTKRLRRTYQAMGGDSVGRLSSENTNNTRPILSHRTYQVVVAATPDMGIGKDGKLPWSLPRDLRFFKEVTSTTSDPNKKNAVMMGRKTWESIPNQFRPLPGRLNIILTRSRISDASGVENVILCDSIPSALKLLVDPLYSFSIEKVFLVGGGQILREALNAPECDAIHLTEIKTSIDCDTFIPPIDPLLFQPWYSSSPFEENGIQYCFKTYVRMHTSDGSHLDSKRLNKLSDFTFLPKFIFEKHGEFL